MASASTAPTRDFRLGMLVYDTRYRAITIQVIVFILLMSAMAWLTNNLIENLAAKGKDLNFGFLLNRAGYKVEPHLINYTMDDSHLRASVVGLLNTIVVAVLGCILATVVGVLAGVLRLSRNWLVARIMTVYVEMFRNIPLLLWIILVYSIMADALPEPKTFKVIEGQEPVSRLVFGGTTAFTNRGAYFPSINFTHGLGGLDLTYTYLSFSWLALIALLLVSLKVNGIIRAKADAVQEATGTRPTIWWQSLGLLILPVLALFLAMGPYLEAPEFKGFNFTGGILVFNSFTALLIALVLYTGAFIAEIVRAGIQAISRGQSEAAFALGLRPGRTTRLIILPQALRVIIPPLISQFLNLTKNTSLAIAVSYMDLRGTLGGIALNQTGRELECMLLLMLTYLGMSLSISAMMNLYNRSVRLKER